MCPLQCSPTSQQCQSQHGCHLETRSRDTTTTCLATFILSAPLFAYCHFVSLPLSKCRVSNQWPSVQCLPALIPVIPLNSRFNSHRSLQLWSKNASVLVLFQSWGKTRLGTHQRGSLHGLENKQLGGVSTGRAEGSESGKAVKASPGGGRTKKTTKNVSFLRPCRVQLCDPSPLAQFLT